jgi:hypothetical protein
MDQAQKSTSIAAMSAFYCPQWHSLIIVHYSTI